MGSKVHLKRHLEADELHRLYKEAKVATERTHRQIWLSPDSGSPALCVERLIALEPALSGDPT